MITALIICITLVVCLCLILKWATDMAKAGLPMFTRGELVWRPADDTPCSKPPIGFAPEEVQSEEKAKSDRELFDEMLKDSASTISALLRGEVDFDEIKQ